MADDSTMPDAGSEKMAADFLTDHPAKDEQDRELNQSIADCIRHKLLEYNPETKRIKLNSTKKNKSWHWR